MNTKALKFILDIESIISEIEEIRKLTDGNFFNFQNNIIYKRAVERDLEIIGEAIRKLSEIETNLNISSIKKIIGIVMSSCATSEQILRFVSASVVSFGEHRQQRRIQKFLRTVVAFSVEHLPLHSSWGALL